MTGTWKTVAALALVVGACSVLLTVLLFDHVQDLREKRTLDTSAAIIRNCKENNEQNAILAGLLKAALAPDRDQPPSPRFLRESDRAFAALKPIDCAQLRALKPFVR